MNGLRLATLFAFSAALLACRGSQYPPGAIGIYCTDRSKNCKQKMERACPNGYFTLKEQRLLVRDVVYGADVLELTYVIKCRPKQPEADPSDATPARVVIRRNQVEFGDQIVPMGADDRLHTIGPLYEYLRGMAKDRAYPLVVDADADARDMWSVLLTGTRAGHPTAEFDFAGHTIRLHVRPEEPKPWRADWPAETLMAVVYRDAVELWRVSGTSDGFAPRRISVLAAREVHTGGAPAVARACREGGPRCSPAVLVFAPGATYSAASTVLDGLANAAADAGVVADVLVQTAPLGYIRDTWRLETPAASNDGSWSLEAALAPARRLRLAAERTGAGGVQALPTSVGIRQDLTDAADDAYDVALASYTPTQKQAVLRECALMWLAFDERLDAQGPDAWVNAWGERPRVRARRQLERCTGFGEDKDCEALLQKLGGVQ